MVNGPGSVILAWCDVLARRKRMSRTSTGPRRLIGPVMRGTTTVPPERFGTSAGLSASIAVQREGETVGVALAADLAVGDDVDPGPFHVADGDDGRVVLRLLEERRRDAPDLGRVDARHALRAQRLGVDQPFRLRIAADDGRGEESLHR